MKNIIVYRFRESKVNSLKRFGEEFYNCLTKIICPDLVECLKIGH